MKEIKQENSEQLKALKSEFGNRKLAKIATEKENYELMSEVEYLELNKKSLKLLLKGLIVKWLTLELGSLKIIFRRLNI